MLHDKGDLGLDTGFDEATFRNGFGSLKSHCIQKDAAVWHIDVWRHLYRLGRQANIPADFALSLGIVQVHQCCLNPVGAIHIHARIGQGDRLDLIKATQIPDPLLVKSVLYLPRR